jgi:hypothetical protein
LRGDLSAEKRILAEHFKAPSPKWVPMDVDSRPQDHMYGLRATFLAELRPDVPDVIEVERRCEPRGTRKAAGRLSVEEAVNK